MERTDVAPFAVPGRPLVEDDRRVPFDIGQRRATVRVAIAADDGDGRLAPITRCAPRRRLMMRDCHFQSERTLTPDCVGVIVGVTVSIRLLTNVLHFTARQLGQSSFDPLGDVGQHARQVRLHFAKVCNDSLKDIS